MNADDFFEPLDGLFATLFLDLWLVDSEDELTCFERIDFFFRLFGSRGGDDDSWGSYKWKPLCIMRSGKKTWSALLNFSVIYYFMLKHSWIKSLYYLIPYINVICFFYCFLKFWKRQCSRTVDRSIVLTVSLACSDVIQDSPLEALTYLQIYYLVPFFFCKYCWNSDWSGNKTVISYVIGNSQTVFPRSRG
jgi:hypothetical protein